MTEFALWIQEQWDNPHFKHLMTLITEKRDVSLELAIKEGNTDFIKGRYSALNWVVNLPKTIVEQSTEKQSTEADT